MSYNQRIRRQIINSMQTWIKDVSQDGKPVTEDVERAIVGKAMLVYGCTLHKAREYMDVIFGRI